MKTHTVQSSAPSDFLFLNTTAGGKSKDARAHVVQRQRRHKKELHARLARRRGQKPPIPPRSELEHPSYIPIRSPGVSTQAYEVQKFEKNSSDAEESKDERSQWIGTPPCSTEVGPLSILWKGCTDPFSTTPVPVDPVTVHMLKFSREWYINLKWSLGGILQRHHHSEGAWAVDMRNAISGKAAFYAALAVACHYTANLCENPPSSAILLKGLQYKILSMRCVREDIENQTAVPQIIQAVLDLASTEFFASNFPTSWLHLQAAKTMIDTLKGLGKMEEIVRDTSGLIDYVVSSSLLKRPTFRVQDWDPGPWEAQFPTIQPSTYLFTFYQDLERRSANSLDSELPTVFLRAAFAEMRALLSIRKSAVSIDDRQCSSRALRWVHIRTTAIYVGLYDHYFDDIKLSQASEKLPRKAEGQLAAAIFFAARYCHSFVTYAQATILTLFPVQRIYGEVKNALRGLDQVLSNRRNLALWLYFVGSVVEELAGEYTLSEHEGSLKSKFQAGAKSLELVSDKEISNILKCFIYDESLYVFLRGWK